MSMTPFIICLASPNNMMHNHCIIIANVAQICSGPQIGTNLQNHPELVVSEFGRVRICPGRQIPSDWVMISFFREVVPLPFSIKFMFATKIRFSTTCPY